MRVLAAVLFSCSLAVNPVIARAEDKWANQSSMAGFGPGSVNTHNGSYTTSIPVAVPDYFGIEPEISVGYSSDGRYSPLSRGWGLGGLSGIERVSRLRGQPRFNNTDIFLLDGMELIPCASQTADPQSPSCAYGGSHSTKIETFKKIKYVQAGNTWQVWDQTGVKKIYKALETRRVNSTNYTVSYGIGEVVDLYGRKVFYDYVFDLNGGNSVHIDQIRYNDGRYRLKFFWQGMGSSQSYTFAFSGQLGQVTSRLRTIAVYVTDPTGEKFARGYHLLYQGRNDRLSHLSVFGSGATLTPEGEIATGDLASQTMMFEYNDTPGPITNYYFRDNFPHYITTNPVSQHAMELFFQRQGINERTAVDINGDGLTDVVRSARIMFNGTKAPGAWYEAKEVLINEGGPFHTLTEDTSWNLPANTSLHELELPSATVPAQAWPQLTTIQDAKVRSYGQFADLNGDGRVDYTYKTQRWLNTGRGWQNTTKWAFPGTYRNDQLQDINGDDLADLLRVTKTADGATFNEVYLNTGEAFERATEWDLPYTDQFLVNEFPADKDKKLLMLADSNDDGLPDLYPPSGSAYMNTGRGFTALTTNPRAGINQWEVDHWIRMVPGPVQYMRSDCGDDPFAGETLRAWKVAACSDSSPNGLKMIGDFNGDGLSDLVFAGNNASGSRANPSLLTQITTPYRGEINIEYKSSVELDNTFNCNSNGTADEDGTYKCQGLPSVKWVVNSVTVQSDPVSVTNFDYAGGLYDGTERAFLGFRYVKETLPNILQHPLYVPRRETWYRMAQGEITTPEREDFTAGVSTPDVGTELVLLTSKVYDYETNSGAIPKISRPKSEWNYSYDNSGTVCPFTSTASPCAHGMRTRVDYAYDRYGNGETVTNHGDFDRTGDETVTTNKIKINHGSFITNLPYETQTTSNGVLVSKSRVYYDGSGSLGAQPIKGKPTKTGSWLNTLGTSGNYVYSLKTFNADTGLLETSTDPGGAVTRYFYDSFYGFLLAETRNHYGHSSSTEWNYICGLPKEVSDANNQISRTTYDGLCRTLRADSPGGSYQRFDYNSDYVVAYSPVADSSGEIYTKSFFDGFGRVFKTQTLSPNGNQNSIVERRFDARGRLTQESVPVEFGVTNNDWIYHYYDPLDRSTQITMGPSTMYTEYTHNTVVSTDPEGSKQMKVVDANGRLLEERELDDSGNWLTKFMKYNAKGELYEIKDHAGNTWSMEYDSFGRKTRMVDPDAGTSTMTYDSNGQLIRTVSNSGSITTYDYDDIGRMLEKVVDSGTAQAKSYLWFYDEVRPGYFNVGRLTSTIFPEGGRVFNYDAAGRVKNETALVDGRTYTRSYTYTNSGYLSSTTYPDSTAVSYIYSNGGALRSIPGYIDLIEYDLQGNLKRLRNSNGTDTNYTYDAKRGWATFIETRRSSTQIDYLTLSNRDRTGRLRGIASPESTWAYTYDALGQLKTASSGLGQNEAFTYDGLGNITTARKYAVTQEYRYGKSYFGSTLGEWQENYGESTEECRAVPGDMDADGDVDGRDFLARQRGQVGSPGTELEFAL